MASIVSGLRKVANTPALTLSAAMGLSYTGLVLSPTSIVSRLAVREAMKAGITEAANTVLVKPLLSKNLRQLRTHQSVRNATLSSFYRNNVRTVGMLMTAAGCLYLATTTMPTALYASYELKECASNIDLTSLDQIGRLLSVGSLFSTALATANISADFIAGGIRAIGETMPRRQEPFPPMYRLV